MLEESEAETCTETRASPVEVSTIFGVKSSADKTGGARSAATVNLAENGNKRKQAQKKGKIYLL